MSRRSSNVEAKSPKSSTTAPVSASDEEHSFAIHWVERHHRLTQSLLQNLGVEEIRRARRPVEVHARRRKQYSLPTKQLKIIHSRRKNLKTFEERQHASYSSFFLVQRCPKLQNWRENSIIWKSNFFLFFWVQNSNVLLP